MRHGGIIWPVAHCNGTTIFFDRSPELSRTWFGGPVEQKFTGVTFGPAPLHRIVTFETSKLPQPDGHNLNGELPLFIGMQYEGCRIRYKLPVSTADHVQYTRVYNGLEVLELDPVASDDDWPYLDYPRILPYHPLRERERRQMTTEEFADTFDVQGLADHPLEMVFVVPACPLLGVSIWGKGGDAAEVFLVFKYNFETHEVCGESQCD